MKLRKLFMPGLLALLSVQAHAQDGQAAAPSFSAGIGIASYAYREPGIMKIEGSKVAAEFGVNGGLAADYFGAAALRYVTGNVDYRSDARYGSAAESDKRDYYVEARALAGRLLRYGGLDVAPFAGLGYRYLYNDLRGVNSLGQAGNRRTNAMFYLPVGVTLAHALHDGARAEASVEWDPLLHGRQDTRLSDAQQEYGDVSSTQRVGFGVKLHLAYATQHWEVQPYIDYWRIEASDTAPLLVNGMPDRDSYGQKYIQEPRNRTTEAGVKVAYRF
ncbi:hypothetical protein [Massilia rhizosphaerae]|uniref:hypothetical protein n=1 Tax=Massilia rhizosphaerae TaxID=2784389 RepID=UPI0018DE89C9|nr:hypothetical protein [Massilia rhizosphaerae]